MIEEECNPSSTERLTSEKLATVEKYIEEDSVSYVYTRQIAAKKPFTENVRKAMTECENVKKSARTSLLGNNDYKPARSDRKFDNEDQQIFPFEYASTSKPARLNEILVSYMRSVAWLHGMWQCSSNMLPCDKRAGDKQLSWLQVFKRRKE